MAEGQGKAEASLCRLKAGSGNTGAAVGGTAHGVKETGDPKGKQQLREREGEDPAAGTVESVRSPYLLIMEPIQTFRTAGRKWWLEEVG